MNGGVHQRYLCKAALSQSQAPPSTFASRQCCTRFTVEYLIHHGYYDNIRKFDNTSRLKRYVNDLTGFQRDLLYVIGGLDEPHGLAVKDVLEDYYDTEIHHGRLYPNLDTLVEKGLVKKGQRDRRTNSYTPTDRGRRELKARREWENQYIGDLSDIESTTD